MLVLENRGGISSAFKPSNRHESLNKHRVIKLVVEGLSDDRLHPEWAVLSDSLRQLVKEFGQTLNSDRNDQADKFLANPSLNELIESHKYTPAGWAAFEWKLMVERHRPV